MPCGTWMAPAGVISSGTSQPGAAVAPGERRHQTRRGLIRSRAEGDFERGRRLEAESCMAESTSVAHRAAPIPSSDEIARAEKLVRERFLHEGEDPSQTLAAGTPRRAALDLA